MIPQNLDQFYKLFGPNKSGGLWLSTTVSDSSIPQSSPSPHLAFHIPEGTSSTFSETKTATTQLVYNNPTIYSPAPPSLHSPSSDTRIIAESLGLEPLSTKSIREGHL